MTIDATNTVKVFHNRRIIILINKFFASMKTVFYASIMVRNRILCVENRILCVDSECNSKPYKDLRGGKYINIF